MRAENITTWKKKNGACVFWAPVFFSKSFGGKIQPFSNRCCREVNIKQPEHAWYKYPFLSFLAGKQNVLTSRLLVNSFNEKTNQMLVSIKSKKYIHEYAWLKMSEKSAVIENLRTTFPFYLCLVRSLALERQSFLLLFSWFEYLKL